MLDNLKQPEQQLLIEDQLLRDLVEISPDQQRQILTESVENNVVSPRVSTDLNHVLATIEIIKLRLARERKTWGGRGDAQSGNCSRPLA